MSHDVLYSVRVEGTRDVAALFDCLEVEEDGAYSVWTREDEDYALVEAFCEDRAEAELRLAAVTRRLEAGARPGTWTAQVRPVRREDWAESWKQHFHAERVSERLWVKPTWESVTIPPGHFAIEMDPGMSFGTGQHPTTRACLLYLDWLAARRSPPGSLLDLGCGSGILAIAGARLGFQPVLALDCDPDAVRIAAENAQLNRVETLVACRAGDLANPGLPHPFDVVVANVLSSVLIAHAPAVSACAAPRRAALVLSGILTAEYPAVREAYARHGWRELDAVAIGEWTSGLLERGGGAA